MKTRPSLGFLIFFALATAVFSQSSFESAMQAYESGDYEKAILRLGPLLKENKGDHRVRKFLAISYARLKRHDLANRTFNEAPLTKNWREIESKRGYSSVKITSRKQVSLTESARRNMFEGRMKVAAEFNKNGKVTYVYPITKLPYGMTEKITDAVRNFEFEPAAKDGKKITDIVILVFHYSTI